MRKIFFIVGFTVVNHFSTQAQQQASKIMYVDVEYIFSKIPESKQLEEQLKATQAKLQTEFSTKQQQFQKQYSDYSSAANNMADTTRQKTERYLQALNSELQEFDRNAQLTLENTRKLYAAPAYLKISNAIARVAEENGYNVIFQKKVSGYDLLLYANQVNDVSDLVIKKLTTAQPTTK